MKKVVVLTTGGTIASIKNKASGLYTSGAMPGEQLVDRERLGPDMDESLVIEARSVFQVPSNAMDCDKLLVLRDRLRETLADPEVLGAVVTHGTDTLEESSYFMDLVLGAEKPVVFTGAQRTPGEEGTDAYTNIRDSIVAAACPACRGLGVLLVFNEGVYSARHVRKVHAFNIHAFTSPGRGQLGFVDKGTCYIQQRPATREHYELDAAPPRVDVVRAGLGADGAVVRLLADDGSRGIILDGLGRGHVPPAWMDDVQYALDKGLPMVVTSACGEGCVHPVYDFGGGVKDLVSRGVVMGHDYPSSKARIKLMVLLAAGRTAPAEIDAAFAS
ncbi:asparaginase [Desulfocurvus sp. DL9XJH121]